MATLLPVVQSALESLAVADRLIAGTESLRASLDSVRLMPELDQPVQSYRRRHGLLLSPLFRNLVYAKAGNRRALRNLAIRIHWRLQSEWAEDRAVREALQARARDTGKTYKWMKRYALMTGVAMALAERHESQYVRQGKQWVTRNGRRAAIRPYDRPYPFIFRWLFIEARKAAVAWALDRPYPATGRSQPRHTSLPVSPMSASGAEQDPLEQLLARERIQEIWAATSPRQRDILTLLVEGLSHAEVAQRLKLSPSTVDVQLYRLRQKLRSA